MMRGAVMRRVLAWAGSGALLAGLVACASTNQPKPTELTAQPVVQTAAWAWHVPMGEGSGVLRLQVVDQTVFAASDDGDLLALEASTGRVLWRMRVPDGLSAGVGGDAKRVAVVTLNNELLSIESGEVRWRVRLPARVLTPPLVAGGRVFVALSDRSTMAFDGSTGARLWTQPRSGDPLVLRQAGVLLAVGDTLVSGGLGRLQGLN
ncbi:MAG: PQQ-binding-like beta-propeller repeat protein, partial [Hydrogenophaga sp.]|nr:PQQ-binding-like beta-propeller repeat protein [Hydrogenophaga sp.]